MDRRMMKRRAIRLIGTSRPSPYLITALVYLFSRVASILSNRIGGQPFLLDMDAVSAMDMENAFVFVPENISALGTTFLLAFQILMVLLNFGYISYCLHVCREEKAEFGDLLDGFTVALHAIVLSILRGILISVGLMLFIIPGIVLSYMYSMSSYLLMDHPEWSSVQCMRESRRMMRGHKQELFVLHLSFFGWFLLMVIPLMEIFVKPYVQLTETGFYLHLAGGPDAERGDFFRDPPEDKPPWEY